MRVLLASAAYLTVAAGGVSLVVASAHTLATTASPHLQLPVTKPNAPPSLVERRLIAQAAPLPDAQPLRRVVALRAPDMPLAQLARGLDEAETAFDPPAPVRGTEQVLAAAVEPTAVKPASDVPATATVSTPEIVNTSSQPLLQVVALEITRAEFGQPVIAPLQTKRRPKQHSVTHKRKPKPVFVAKARGPVQLASLETPGNLMTRGFLKRQS